MQISKMISLDFSVRSDTVVVGRNPEMADMVNPQGYIYGESLYVAATDDRGYRWAHDHTFVDDSESAFELCRKIGYAFEAGRDLSEDHWDEVDPVYGSKAYVNEGTEAIQCARERKED